MLLISFAVQAAMISGISRFHVEQSKDGSHGIIETIGPHRTKFYPLPQSTAREYRLLRPKAFRLNPFRPEQYERQEVIGPYQVENGKIWFGKDFYDGEGDQGVGAFGYFDISTCRYTLFSPPEVARNEVSAILVEPNVVWVALDHFGEDISKFSGGLIRWDRNTHLVRHYALEFVVDGIRVQGDSLRLNTRGGYALLRDEEVQRYLKSGRPIRKFPPPPSMW